MATRTISNSDNLIDSRQVIERIAELEGERDEHVWTDPEGVAEDRLGDAKEWAEENPDDAAELASLLALQEEAEGYAPDWKYGATLIRDSYFETYAEELAEEIGEYDPATLRWPLTCIDWEQAARELQQDYTSVDWLGVAYWVR